MTLFSRPRDYEAFERVLEEAETHRFVPLLSYCLMPNHWHMVVRPEEDRDLSAFMFWLTMTHAQRWRHARHLVGLGPLYQGRFRAFPVQTDTHLWTVCRYVERNPVRAGLVRRAEEWQWSSLWRRVHGTVEQRGLLSPWPTEEPKDWVEWVNEPQTETELETIRASVHKARPYGEESWQRRTATEHGLESSLRATGRPKSLPDKE